MNAEILAVVTESLPGDTANSNSQFLSHELATYGLHVTHMTTVDSAYTHLRDALRHALSRSELVVIFGGLGNDLGNHSRDAVADVIGTPLELHEESLERIREYFINTSREMPVDSQRQAMLPRGCTVFPNDHGTAPGCAVTRYEQQVLLLPGTPSELLPMFSDYVAPYLTLLVDGTIVSRTVGVFGLSEATLTERLADLMSEANPGVVSYAKDGEAILRVTARAADRRAALALCNPVVEEIQKRLSVNVYGVDVGSLQKAVVVLLLDKHMKIATAESCTAGLLSGRLTEVSGVSAVFECGIAAYSREIKHNILGVPEDTLDRFGTVSPEVASAMAVGVRRVGKASLGVGITGVAGPDASEGKPVGTVYIALADEKRVWVKKIAIDILDGAVDRESIRALATSHALDLVRRYLEALPTVMAGGEILAPEVPTAPVIPQSDATGKKHGFLRRILPWKGDGKIEILRKSALIAAFMVLSCALFAFVYLRVLRPMQNEWIFRDLASLYDSSSPIIPTNADMDYPDGMMPQFYALYARNTDVRGWVKIDDTNINYPVMRDNGTHYYRNHNFNRQLSNYGVPYFDASTALGSPNSVNRSLVIYGNNMGSGQMFSDLTEYFNDLDFLRSHPLVEMNTLYKSGKWKIFSVMVAATPDVDNIQFDYTRTVFADETDFLGFADQLRVRSIYSIPQADVQEGDSLLLLSTGFEDVAEFDGARLVIAARQVRPGEADTVDLSGVDYNNAVIMPPGWKLSSESGQETIRAQSTRTLSPQTTEATHIGSDETTDNAETSTSVKAGSSSNSASLSKPATTATTSTNATTTIPETEGPTTQAPDTNPTTTRASTTTTSNSSSSPSESGESVFLQNCKVQNGNVVVEPSNKQELQMLLARIVKREIGTLSMMGNNLAAQKAQAIATYTYILNYNRSHSDPYSYPLETINLANETDKKIYDAVGEVAGIKILSGSSPIYATYCASTPGFTSDNVSVFGADLPYLESVASLYETADRMPASWESTFSISMSTLTDKLKNKFNADISYDTGSAPFYVKEYDKNGQYVLKTNAYYLKNGVKIYVTGYQLRAAVGAADLRSHAFTVTSSTSSTLMLAVTGYGHGVGLSQWGAALYANYAGWDYRQILSHYYSITATSPHQLVNPDW